MKITYVLALLLALTFQDVTSGKWMIKEMANINYYPRWDFEFIETHAKDFVLQPFDHSAFGWSLSIYNVKVKDIVNKGVIFPGPKHMDATSVSWDFDEAFYIDMDFEYVYNLGILPLSGKGTIYLHCNKAKYIMEFKDLLIVPTLECGIWKNQDIKITSGVSIGKMTQHITEAFDKDQQIPTLLVSTFTRVMTNYYTYDYREKTGFIEFNKLKTKILVDFQWTDATTNLKDTTVEFEYQMRLTPTPTNPRLNSIMVPPPKDAPTEYSRMYFVSKQVILDAANIVLPKVIDMPILINMIPADSYWQLEFWNLQKVLPDLLMRYPDNEQTDFHLLINYLPQLSNPVLTPYRKFSDFPVYRLSGLQFSVDFIKEGTPEILLKTNNSLWVDLQLVVEERAPKNMIVVKFTATHGDMTNEQYNDNQKGGFVFRRGLDEFLDEGFNDYLCKQLGYGAFGSGLQFEDYSHKGGILYTEPQDDGVYIYLE